MDTLNRVLLSILFALVALASVIGVLLVFEVITPEQVQSVIPYQQVANFFRTNLTASALISLLLVVIVLVLGALWLRGQFARAVTAVVGGQYETRAEAPGSTIVSYGIVARAIDNAIRGIPGVVDSRTRIFAEREGELFAESNLTVKRSADTHNIDDRVRNSINREWLDKLGTKLAHHDVSIDLEPVEPRVA